MEKHTPGPWTYLEREGTIYSQNGPICKMDDSVFATEKYLNAQYNLQHQPYVDEVEANARLIAAAPELLEALKYVYFHLEHREGLRHRVDLFTEDERNILHAAIAKAEGRE